MSILDLTWHKKANKWQASLGHENKNVHLGLFLDYFEACCARKSAELQYAFHTNHGNLR